MPGAGFGGDGGGFWFGPDGRIHIIPPWNPDEKYAKAVHEVLVAVSGVSAATTIQQAGIRQQAVKAAVETLTSHVGNLGGLVQGKAA
jgi:hypothetical protein